MKVLVRLLQLVCEQYDKNDVGRTHNVQCNLLDNYLEIFVKVQMFSCFFNNKEKGENCQTNIHKHLHSLRPLNLLVNLGRILIHCQHLELHADKPHEQSVVYNQYEPRNSPDSRNPGIFYPKVEEYPFRPNAQTCHDRQNHQGLRQHSYLFHFFRPVEE